jgi:hypothetical protein
MHDLFGVSPKRALQEINICVETWTGGRTRSKSLDSTRRAAFTWAFPKKPVRPLCENRGFRAEPI